MDMESALPASIRALPMTGDAVKAHRLMADGCEVLFVTAPAGTQLAMHDHDTHNATVIISGGMVLITDHGETHHGPGEWYQTQPGQKHALRYESDTMQIELRFTRS